MTDSWVLLSLINTIGHESVIRNPLISLETRERWRFYFKYVHGASLFLLIFLSCGMLNVWCAKLVLKTCRLNFHGRNQSILKEVFLMACRHGEIFVQYDLYKITETD